MASGNLSGLTPTPYITFQTKCGGTLEVWKDHTRWWDVRYNSNQMDFKYLPFPDNGLSDAIYEFCDLFNLCLVDQEYTITCIQRVTGLTRIK